MIIDKRNILMNRSDRFTVGHLEGCAEEHMG